MTQADKPLNLYLVSQDVNPNRYETYDSCVVATTTYAKARHIHPSGHPYDRPLFSDTWAKPSDCHVKLIGTAKPGTKEGVICASYNAG